MEQACVVIVEQGGEFGPSAEALLRDGDYERVMVVQQPGETPAELALRVTRRAALLRHSGIGVGQAVIAAGERADDQIFQARCQIARALLNAMTAPEPELTFSAARRIPDAARHELMAIAGTLTGQLHGTPIQVSLRFGDSSERADRALATTKSGVFREADVREVA